jgi:hypothetical protein
LAHPIAVHLLTKKLPPSPSHRVPVKPEELGDLAIATVAKLLGLQARIETPLLLIEEAVQ